MKIYDTPQSDLKDTDEIDSSSGRSITTSVLGFIAFSIYLVPYMFIPQFSETFASFGSDIPWLTTAVIKLNILFLLLSLLSLFLNLVWVVRWLNPKVVALLFKVSVGNIIVSFLCLFICFVAMYLPVFYIGTVL